MVPGDHPDPTIIEVDGVFWASATSGEWSPQFPLFRSNDLVTWLPAGAIFPVQPAWAEGSFWAPELVHDEVTGRFVAWYVGRKRGGPLCVAVATADRAEGPYEDHGPLICEEDGSIDPCFARDEHGVPYLIWKEDGNSQGRPTPIWAQQLSKDLLTPVGEKTMLIVNDAPWEEGVVEGPYVMRHGGWFYMFYAGNSCCGRECKYAEGVARSKRLLGPWEKFAGNPIIGANDAWRCPGHGTAVRGRGGRDYLLYHAYPAGETIYVGREAVLDEIRWEAGEDGDPGWPVVNGGRGPGATSGVAAIDFRDDFSEAVLGSAWQWPVNTQPTIVTGDGLRLGIQVSSPLAAGPVEAAMVAVSRPVGLHYSAQVGLRLERVNEALWAGLAVVGDPFNTLGLGMRGGKLQLWKRRGNWQAVLWESELGGQQEVQLRCEETGGEQSLQFWYAIDDGAGWVRTGDMVDASDLPAWDRGLRIGLMLEGPAGATACFEAFSLVGADQQRPAKKAVPFGE